MQTVLVIQAFRSEKAKLVLMCKGSTSQSIANCGLPKLRIYQVAVHMVVTCTGET